MQSAPDRVDERYRRERFLRAANSDFWVLKKDGKAWKQELREREEWEESLTDGLSNE